MLINGERALAYVVRIDDIQPIEGADRIELVKVGGWNVVAQKGLYAVGDLAVYCEVDSWIPHTIAPFLTQDGHYPKVFNEVEGQRLKTKRLRGVYSQGLLLPLQQSSYNDMALIDWFTVSHDDNDGCPAVREGDDVTELLGIQKWEKPLPAELRGLAKGNFPGFIPKTDQERCLFENTVIDTSVGKITIKEIVDNKLLVDVLSYNHTTNEFEYKKVEDWSVMRNNKDWLKIKTKNGREIICTSNHKIWCEDIKAYREAKNLKIGQKVIVKTET